MTDSDPGTPRRKPQSFSFEDSPADTQTARKDRPSGTSGKPRKLSSHSGHRLHHHGTG